MSGIFNRADLVCENECRCVGNTTLKMLARHGGEETTPRHCLWLREQGGVSRVLADDFKSPESSTLQISLFDYNSVQYCTCESAEKYSSSIEY